MHPCAVPWTEGQHPTQADQGLSGAADGKSASISSKIAQVDHVAVLDFLVFACEEFIQVRVSKDESVRLRGAVVAAIGIALLVEQHIAPLPSRTGYAPA